MRDYDRIKTVIQFLDTHQEQQPSLEMLADHIGLSESHLQRLFSRWAGISPKAFLKCLTLKHARALLQQGKSVLDASLDSGLSGPGRLHDLCVTLESASPGEIKSGGAGWTLVAGIAESPFGNCLIAQSPRGICHLSFIDHGDRDLATSELLTAWPHAEIEWSPPSAQSIAASVFQPATGTGATPKLKALVKGTEFQVRVWRALLELPSGSLASYGQIANRIEQPNSSRAVGSAVGQNAIAYLIPCHRVIRDTGVIGQYRWGSIRKKAMLAWESRSADQPTESTA